MAVYQFRRQQKLHASREEIWNFISSPKNLEHITPPSLGFTILSQDLPKKMYPGMIITYHVSPLFGIKMKWVTEITQVVELQYFIDEQRVGPYRMWHHQHHLEELSDGINMIDIVTYQPPLGIAGRIANALIIDKKLNEIFDYRFEVLRKKYGTYKRS